MVPVPPPLPVQAQVASVQQVTPPPAQAATTSRFKDLNPSQARWLEVLEKHGILKTNPASQLFGPEQSVRRDELLMSEARIIELMVRRDQEQQVLIERLRGEVAQLRSERTLRTTTLQGEPAAAVPAQAFPGRGAESAPAASPGFEPVSFQVNTTLPATLSPGAAQPPEAVIAPRQAVPKITRQPVEAVPMAVRADKPVQVARLNTGTEAKVDATPARQIPRIPAPGPVAPVVPRVEVLLHQAEAPVSLLPVSQVQPPSTATALQAIVRHRNKLRQFPRLQRFLDRAAHLDPESAQFEDYVRTYLTSAGLTSGMLAEAARQAAWFDAQQAV